MTIHQLYPDNEGKAGPPAEFTFEGHSLRTVQKDGAPWFVVSDLCQATGLSDVSDAAAKLDDDEKGRALIPTPGGKQELLIVNESGLYAIVLRCRDAMTPGSVSHRFRKWVTRDVLPSIRKTGRYQVGQESVAQEVRPNEQERFHKIYNDGSLSPDDLLMTLFRGRIPFTDHPLFQLYFDESCDALGISDPESAFERLPQGQTATLLTNTPSGSRSRRAITEPALYCLAFEPRSSMEAAFGHAMLTADALCQSLRKSHLYGDAHPILLALESTLRVYADLAQVHLGLNR